METTAEIKRLQSCINDLISLLALPAIWTGSGASHILGTLLEALLTMLRLDFVYARLSDVGDSGPIQVVRLGDHRHSSVQPQQVAQALDHCLTAIQNASSRIVRDPFGEGEVSIAAFSLGIQHEGGVLVAGSSRTDFPTQVEHLLLQVAANQAAIGLQEARRSGEQKRVAEMLEERVAERTRQLLAVNEELRRSEAYLAKAQSLSHAGSFGWRPSTGKLIWSEETFRIFQYEQTTIPTVQLALQRVHPEDVALVEQTIERASQNGKDFEHEYRLLMPDGSVKHVHAVARGLSDESGAVEFVGAVMDITAAKEAQDRIQLVINTMPALIWTARPDGRLDSISQRWLEYAGISIETAHDGELGERTVHPDDIQPLRDKWRVAVNEGTPFEAEIRVRCFDGKYRWFLSRACPLRDHSGHILGWYGNDIDIEDRRQAEESLRRSEGYLTEAQRLTHTGSWVWRVAGRDAVYLSEEWYRIYGFDPQAGMPSWAKRLQRIHPEDRARWAGTIDRAIAERSDYEVEFRILLSDGTVRYVHSVGHPVMNVSGDLVEFVGSSTDVTDRRRAEEALRRSENYLAEAQRLTRSGSWAWDVRTGALFWSQEVFRIFECSPDTVNPTWSEFFEWVHPEDRPKIAEIAKMESTQKDRADSEADFRIVLANGKIKHLHTIAHPVTDGRGEIAEVVGTVMDVTERVRAEALRDGESRILEMIARDAPLEQTLEKLVRVVEAQFAGLLSSVLLLDDDGKHLRHGAAPSLPKDYVDAIDGLSIGPKAGSCGTAMYRREAVVVADILEDPLWEAYRDVVKPYGFRACWSTPILAHSGKPLGSFAMYYCEPRSPSAAETRALDMATHLAGIAIGRKRAREERDRLRQAQADLARMNRVSTIGELTASLAHEIKQPIAAALTDAKTCLRWLDRETPEVSEAGEAASRIVTDVTRAADIISRIRLLFKKETPQWELVDVNEVIREMIVLLRSEAMQYSASVRAELSDLPHVMADRVQLQQVLMNLLANGIDAMKDVDGIRELIVRSRAENGQITISVTDTGMGLPQQADQIFNPFFTTKPNGTGMGLRISRSIVESHGGRLWGENNASSGASFHLTLPTSSNDYQ